jgi:DNA-directed RNA polymerase specialized sigma24 family protein
MKNFQMTAANNKVNKAKLSGELRPFCACRKDGDQFQCTHNTACTYWRQLKERTARNSWLDRFLRAFVATRVQGRVLTEASMENTHYQNVMFMPYEGKNIMRDLKNLVYSLQEKYSHPMALYIEGYKFREIAEILEISFVSVLMRIAYARRELLNLIKSNSILRIKMSPLDQNKDQ